MGWCAKDNKLSFRGVDLQAVTMKPLGDGREVELDTRPQSCETARAGWRAVNELCVISVRDDFTRFRQVTLDVVYIVICRLLYRICRYRYTYNIVVTKYSVRE